MASGWAVIALGEGALQSPRLVRDEAAAAARAAYRKRSEAKGARDAAAARRPAGRRRREVAVDLGREGREEGPLLREERAEERVEARGHLQQLARQPVYVVGRQ